MINCKNCGKIVATLYCQVCGHPNDQYENKDLWNTVYFCENCHLHTIYPYCGNCGNETKKDLITMDQLKKKVQRDQEEARRRYQKMVDKIDDVPKAGPSVRRVYICCPVRNIHANLKKDIEAYVNFLERQGVEVYNPLRDTNQNEQPKVICARNFKAIDKATEVHVFYNALSQGVHFDLGIAYALGKTLIIAECVKEEAASGFSQLVYDWQNNFR